MQIADLAPFATLVVASVALFVGLRTVRQRDLADRRDQWWKRYQWATGLTLDPDEHLQDLGFRALELLAGSELAGQEEIELLDAALTAALEKRPALLDDGWEAGHHGRGWDPHEDREGL